MKLEALNQPLEPTARNLDSLRGRRRRAQSHPVSAVFSEPYHRREARRLDGDGGWAILRRVAGAGTSVETRHYAAVLDSLAPGRWAFRLRQTDLDGTATLSPETTATLDAPRVLALTGPAPNPVRGTATLRYTVPTDGRAEVTVFDVAGRRVATLTDAVVTAGAEHRVVVDAGTLAPGLYVVRLRHAAGVRARAVTGVR